MALKVEPEHPHSGADEMQSKTENPPSRCPFSGAAQSFQDSVSDPLLEENNSQVPPSSGLPTEQPSPAHSKDGLMKDDPSFLQRGHVSHVFDGVDPLALPKMLIPWRAVFSLGFLASFVLSTLLPRVALLLVALALLLPSLAVALLRQWKVLRNPEEQDVVRSAMTDKMQGEEFCVFLLGARNNAPLKLDGQFKQVGDTFVSIIKELERLPGSAGYLGGESYVGANMRRGSQVMTVTYWRSYDHLIRFTHNKAQSHVPAMKHFGKLYSTPSIGLWHEMYIVKPGQHESLYVNCPPLGLGAVGGLTPATGRLASSRGRVTASKVPLS